MSDTWSSIQAHKKQLDSLRERLQRRRKQDPLGGTDPRHDLSLATPPRTCSPAPAGPAPPGPASGGASSLGPAPTGAPSPPGGPEGVPGEPSEPDPALERRLLLHLSDLALPLPTDAGAIRAAIAGGDAQVTLRAVESLLHKFAAQELIEVRRGLLHDGPTLVTFADHSKLSAMTGVVAAEKRRAEQDGEGGQEVAAGGGVGRGPGDREPAEPAVHQGAAEQEGEPGDPGAAEHHDGQGAIHRGEVPLAGPRAGAGVLRPRHQGGVREGLRRRPALPQAPLPAHHQQAHGRVAGRLLLPQHLLPHGHLQVRPLRDRRLRRHSPAQPHPGAAARPLPAPGPAPGAAAGRRRRPPLPAPVDLLRHPLPGRVHPGQVRRGHGGPALGHPHGAALRDPDGRRNAAPQHPRAAGRGLPLPLGHRQGHGAGPRMPQPLGRIIRTGRTGHWLNHGKEHCLVGVKGNPQGFNRGLDCDVIVAEVRSTSHKPDEIYGMIERLSPGTRKIELFGRPHNVQPNWITLGNQLDGIHLLDPDVVAQFKQHYPDGIISKPKNM